MKSTDRFVVDGVTCSMGESDLAVANLSVGGLFVVTDRPPGAGQVLTLHVRIHGSAPFPVTGTVTWINEPSHPRTSDLPQGFGLRITKIALQDKLAILDILRRLGPTARRSREG